MDARLIGSGLRLGAAGLRAVVQGGSGDGTAGPRNGHCRRITYRELVLSVERVTGIEPA